MFSLPRNETRLYDERPFTVKSESYQVEQQRVDGAYEREAVHGTSS
ncbi:hypothetical protein [Actinomyces qiguomingii]|nr:hypothetical protein [Actinomyces qiguomingii]